MVSTPALKMSAAAAACAAALVAGQAQAECQLAIEPAQDSWVIQFNPFEDDAAQRQFDVALVNTGSTECRGEVRVDLRGDSFGLSRDGGADRVAYAVLDERSGADVTPRSGQSARRFNGRPVRLSPGERSLARFTLAVSPDESVSQGLYTQTAYFSVQSSDGETLSERPVALGVNVAAAAVMGLKGEFRRSRGAATIDLGELAEGIRPLNASLYVLSTSGYRVSVTSLNQGRLRQAGTAWYVDYGLRLGAEDMNLAQPDSIEVVSRRARFDDYPLTVRIGNVTGKRAGAYSDTLTFTVAAL